MSPLSKILLTILFACTFVITSNASYAAAKLSFSPNCAVETIPLSVTTTVEKHTASYNVYTEIINMTAHVGDLWQANGDVLYQTNNHDVTDLATGEDGRYAVKFTKPGEAVIRVYTRNNGEMYVQDFLFTILEENGGSYAANKMNENAASGASLSKDKDSSTNISNSEYEKNNNDIETFPEQVLRLVNIERAKLGVRPLRLSEDLLAGAKIRAEEISRNFSHTRPDGSSCITVLRNFGNATGENIAAGRATPEAVVDQWMHSPKHRGNMLKKDYSELGVGYFYQGDSVYKHYWIQLFRG